MKMKPRATAVWLERRMASTTLWLAMVTVVALLLVSLTLLTHRVDCLKLVDAEFEVRQEF